MSGDESTRRDGHEPAATEQAEASPEVRSWRERLGATPVWARRALVGVAAVVLLLGGGAAGLALGEESGHGHESGHHGDGDSGDHEDDGSDGSDGSSDDGGEG